LVFLIKTLADVWQSSKKTSSSLREAAAKTMPFIPLVKGLLDAKAEPDAVHAQLLAETLLDIVISTPSDIAAQARWGAVLHRVLKTQRRKLSLSLPWRPWYEMLRRQNIEPSACLIGT
jgi:proteasome activator subunit 4